MGGALAACGGDDDEGQESGQTATKATGTAKPTATKGASAGEGKLNWDDIPVYPKASKVEKASLSFSGGEERKFERLEWRYYTTNDDPGDVHRFYLDKMPDNGWEKIMDITAGEVTYSLWQKDDGNTGAWIGTGKTEGEGKTMIWMWKGQGLKGQDEEIEEGEPEESEEPSSPEPSPSHTPVDPVSYEALIALLPQAPAGWEAENPEGMKVSWGGWAWSEAHGDYEKESGDEDADVWIYDSGYYTNFPWFMTFNLHMEYESSEGYAKSMVYRNLPAFETYDSPDSYSRMIGVAERYLVIVKAQTKDSLEKFCGLIDYDKLADLD